MAVSSAARNLFGCACRFFRIVWAWKMRILKTKFLEFKHWRAQRTMDERARRLGADVYALHKQGETEISRSQIIQQQLRLVDEAERRVLAIYDRIEAIEDDYRRKRLEIAESGQKPEEEED